MDAGSHSISSEKNSAAVHRPPLQEAGSSPYTPSMSTNSRNPLAKCYVSSEIRNLADAYVHKLFDGIA
jgi:cell division cycle protein 20 (cofactor of APC complex)